tara:strand:+ start:283 stop:1170 length:888 start_codon:yes stop_codon:yes gene_type:complete
MTKNIVSFSLWGDNPFYGIGAIRNAETAQKYYKGWISRFYLGTDVPLETKETLESIPNTEVVVIDDEPNNWNGMFWRFYPLSEPDVKLVIFRDTDCRLSMREAAAVIEWEISDKTLHIMRDHPMHTEPIMGGMWGANGPKFHEKCCTIWEVPPESVTTKDIIEAWIANEMKRTKAGENNCFQEWEYNARGIDQKFLRAFVYKLLWNDAYIHDSFPQYNSFSGRFDYQRYPGVKEMSTGFPTRRKDWNDFVGQVWDENEKTSEESSDCLRQRDECIYMDWNKQDEPTGGVIIGETE